MQCTCVDAEGVRCSRQVMTETTANEVPLHVHEDGMQDYCAPCFYGLCDTGDPQVAHAPGAAV